MAINLGDLAKDKLTGFTGIATGKITYLYGCVHIVIEPNKLKDDGTAIPIDVFDEQRVEVIEQNVLVIDATPQVEDPLSFLGNVVKDRLNGFGGTVIAVKVNITGEVSVAIEPTDLTPAGETKETKWVHIQRLEVVKATKPEISKDSTEAKTGGPFSRRIRD